MLSANINVKSSAHLFTDVVCVRVGVCKNLSSRPELLSCLHVCVHAELFVAGLAPWELILHLSIPHSRALILPQIFYQQLTLFSQ